MECPQLRIERQHVVEQPADELEGDILERERRAVEELEHVQIFCERFERRDLGMIKPRVTLRIGCLR